jgi:hypothetical protein
VEEALSEPPPPLEVDSGFATVLPEVCTTPGDGELATLPSPSVGGRARQRSIL